MNNFIRTVLVSFIILSINMPVYSGMFSPNVTHKDFDLLMDLDRFNTQKYFSQADLEELKFYREKYLDKIDLLLKENQSYKIPKTIHFIWVGPKDFPKESIKNIESWKKHHPTWRIKFWTDQAERQVPVKGMEKCLVKNFNWKYLAGLFDKTDNWGEKSDLLRYEILYQEGGVYADHDIECYQSFEILSCYDLYAFLEPPHYNPGISVAIFPTNGLIGSRAEHIIIKNTMLKIIQNWDIVEKKFPGNQFTFIRVLNRTFSSFLSSIRNGLENSNENIIAFPSSFLYPRLDLSKNEKTESIAKRFCFGHHQYAGSWIKGTLKDPKTDEKN